MPLQNRDRCNKQHFSYDYSKDEVHLQARESLAVVMIPLRHGGYSREKELAVITWCYLLNDLKMQNTTADRNKAVLCDTLSASFAPNFGSAVLYKNDCNLARLTLLEMKKKYWNCLVTHTRKGTKLLCPGLGDKYWPDFLGVTYSQITRMRGQLYYKR